MTRAIVWSEESGFLPPAVSVRAKKRLQSVKLTCQCHVDHHGLPVAARVLPLGPCLI